MVDVCNFRLFKNSGGAISWNQTEISTADTAMFNGIAFRNTFPVEGEKTHSKGNRNVLFDSTARAWSTKLGFVDLAPI